MILTNQFEIEKTEYLTSDYIEEQLSGMGIEPLRWAIVGYNEQKYFLEVSYETFEDVVIKDM